MAAQRCRSESLGRSWRQGRPRGGPSAPKEPNGDARQTLRTAWAGGHVCAKAYETLHISSIKSRCENASESGARQTLRTDSHSVFSWTWYPADLVLFLVVLVLLHAFRNSYSGGSGKIHAPALLRIDEGEAVWYVCVCLRLLKCNPRDKCACARSFYRTLTGGAEAGWNSFARRV